MSTANSKNNSKLRQRLLKWYDTHQRDLPWREDQDPWKVWVSEIMLQQTTVDTVIPYFHKFLKRFPDPGSLVRAREETAIKLWEGLGYYHRIRNLKKAAKIVSQKGFPTTQEGWRELPGIGPYASAAISSIVNGQATSVVDGNVYRVLSRLNNDDFEIDSGKSYQHYEAIANELISQKRPGDFNQAMMELGATVCRPRQPHCLLCPWQSECQGQGNWEQLPVKSRKNKSIALQVAVGLIRNKKGEFLMDLRSQKTVMGGLWEFPGGKIEEGETPEEGLIREIREEVGLKIKVLRTLPIVKHAYTKFRVTLHPFFCEVVSGKAKACDKAVEKVAWILPKEWQKIPMPAGSRKILRKLPKDLLEEIS